MTHRGPFQPLLFCDSVILMCRTSRRSAAGGSELISAQATPYRSVAAPKITKFNNSLLACSFLRSSEEELVQCCLGGVSPADGGGVNGWPSGGTARWVQLTPLICVAFAGVPSQHPFGSLR